MTYREAYARMTEVRRAKEALYSLFSAIWAVTALGQLGQGNPLRWAGMSPEDAVRFLVIMLGASGIHMAGIRINGYWRWSPGLRMVALFLMAGCFAWLAMAGFERGSTAFPTYSVIAAAYVRTAWGAFLDLLFNMRSANGNSIV